MVDSDISHQLPLRSVISLSEYSARDLSPCGAGEERCSGAHTLICPCTATFTCQAQSEFIQEHGTWISVALLSRFASSQTELILNTLVGTYNINIIYIYILKGFVSFVQLLTHFYLHSYIIQVS